MEHVPVMLQETLEGLALQPDGCYWDGTFGRGGHSRAILDRLGPNGSLWASDRDPRAAEAAKGLADDPRFHFVPGTIVACLEQVPTPLNGFLWDLGVSTPQLKDPQRGFSFNEDGPLDMRMNPEEGPSAADLVNGLQEKELADLIYKYGEERLSRRIARRILEERPVQTTEHLARICKYAYPRKYHRIHPATRTFQALRIAVNGELEQVETGILPALDKLAPGGRAVVISFHSLEDRIVKHTFRAVAKEGRGALICKKPLVPSEGERSENPAARSAKLRILERLGVDPQED